MIISLLDEIGKYSENASSEELREKLLSHGISIFEPIYNKTEAQGEEKEEKKKFTGQTPKYIILYILYAYSEDSPYLVLGSNPEKEKEAILEKIGIPECWHYILLSLEDDAIRKAVVDYVNQFSTAMWWRGLQLLKVEYGDLHAMVVNKESQKYDKGSKEWIFDSKAHISLSKDVAKMAVAIGQMEDDVKAKHQSKLKFLNSINDERKQVEKKIDSSRGLSIEYAIPAK